MIREGHAGDLATLRAIQSSALDEPWPELLELAVDGPQTLLVLTEGGADAGRDESVADTPIANTPVANTSVANTSVANTSVANTSVADTSTADTPVSDAPISETPVAYALAVVTDDVAYLAEFAVAPGAQGEGRGSELMTALLERFRRDGVAEVRLTARADDERVHAFYGGFGFERRGRIEGHYEDGDGVLFARSLE